MTHSGFDRPYFGPLWFLGWLVSVFSLSSPGTAHAECSVSISGGTPVMNVGEKATFTATVTGEGTPVTYEWVVSGEIIKDYSETTKFPWSVTPMAPEDFQGPSLTFYWKPDPGQIHPSNVGPVERTVLVNVVAGTDACQAQAYITVERNNSDINRQAEDIYLSNHPEPLQGVLRGRALNEHKLWHSSNGFSTPGYGDLFFDFHREYIARLNSWRAEFGYPPVVTWDTGTPIPQGPEINHLNRKSSYLLTPKPTWFTIAGGTGVRSSNGKSCDTGGGQNDLFDFLSRAHLGCAASSPYHGNIHSRVGGDMLNVSLSPVDPLFWRWHAFLDVVSQEWLAGPPAPQASAPARSLLARLLDALIPTASSQNSRPARETRAPQVIYQTPFRLFRYLTELPASVSVTFSEPVTGVKAGDLKVNGSPATQVSGSGAGPYTFTGYRSPNGPNVQLRIAAGQIQDLSGNRFAGAAWQYRLVNRGQDEDRDGIKDDEEADIYLTDPTDPDTDHDGLPDSFEIAHGCLEPLMNQAHPHEMNDNHMPGDNDADDDGMSDAEELTAGTDPCKR